MSKTAIINIISSLLFKTARTVYAHIAEKLNYAFDVVNSSLRFTPPPQSSNSVPILSQSGFYGINRY
ncbi:MAG: hypothetical protein LBH98_09490 [Chitinispirillales bacterium]|nr:hypothetical protein [Chitinispirillales bacterium]